MAPRHSGRRQRCRRPAAGHGGQTLLSLATVELVRDELPPGVELRDLGLHRLKDLARPERIDQLVDHALPRPLTSLVDRERQALCELLARVRLLTITGPGGPHAGRGGARCPSSFTASVEPSLLSHSGR